MLYSTFLVLLIHLAPWSLNENWHIYKIVEPVILTAVVFLVLASRDRSGIFLLTDIIILNDTQKNFKNVREVVENEKTD